MLVEGRSVGARIGAGSARLVRDAGEMHRVRPGDVPVAEMTDPDREPAMKRAAAIVPANTGRPGASGQFRRHPRGQNTPAAPCSRQGDAGCGELP